MRVCMCDFISFHLEAYDTDISAAENTLVYQMPLGNYTDFQVEPSCGLAGMNGVIDTFDDPRSFYSTDRQQAQLIWFSRGYIISFSQQNKYPLEHPGDEFFHGTLFGSTWI